MPATPDIHQIRYLFTDVDDTLTTDGRLLPETLAALYQLEAAGIQVVPVTGGCAGWCDQMIRLWPVAAVIGENGAFYFDRDKAGRVEYHGWDSEQTRSERQQQLLALATRALQQVPEMQLAKDQPYRLADVALDYNQDVSGISAEQRDQVLTLFHHAGAQARASSIHINAWLGDYSKQAMSERLLKQKFGLNDAAIQQQVAYVGDSANDEPMFAYLQHTFGVANIRPWLPSMTHHPRHILSANGGLGFNELAQKLYPHQH
ncbi:HAD-IIB family hydrolase [Marinobacterium stanieri]|uniref:HAD-IIB family hydrolase n=1 Tax=Marinobacterium stanieri TaxID=49186 RepID=UPI003A923479